MIKSWHMRHFELLGYALVLCGVSVPFFAEHLFGTVALSAFTFVLPLGGGAVLLVLNRRSREDENAGGVATLFGNTPMLENSTASSQSGFAFQYASPASSLAEPITSGRVAPEAEFAELVIEYSH